MRLWRLKYLVGFQHLECLSKSIACSPACPPLPKGAVQMHGHPCETEVSELSSVASSPGLTYLSENTYECQCVLSTVLGRGICKKQARQGFLRLTEQRFQVDFY